MLQRQIDLFTRHAVIGEDAEDHRRDRFVKLEQDIADKAIADDHVNRAAVTGAHRNVATLDVALEIQAGRLEQLIGFFGDRIPFFGFFAD